MTMDPNTLAKGLQNMMNTGSQSLANSNLSRAFHDFMLGSASNEIKLVPAIAEGAKAAFDIAIAPMDPTTKGFDAPTLIMLGTIAYWGVLAVPISYGPTSTTVTPPPLLSTLKISLNARFIKNVKDKLELVDATNKIAEVWASICLGGLAAHIIPPSPSVVTFPIL